ncbi:MAG: NB-ARC domain-containing protein [Nitrospirota bacterium]
MKEFKSEVSALVRSKFTTPDDLAKKVAADLHREITSSAEITPPQKDGKSFYYPPMYDNKKVIGRDMFINELRKNIKKHNLLTICGIGGVGKTAVAIETCKNDELEGQYDMFFIAMERLGANASEGQFIDLIAEAMGLPDDARKGLDALIAATKGECAKRPVLLLFDNYESIDEEKGKAVITSLTGVRQLKMLVTSRRKVGIANIEKEKKLKPLNSDFDKEENARLVDVIKSLDSYKILEARVRLLADKDELGSG